MLRCSCGSQNFIAEEEFLLVESREINELGNISSNAEKYKERTDVDYQKSLCCCNCNKRYLIIEDFNTIKNISNLKYAHKYHSDDSAYGTILITKEFYDDELDLKGKNEWIGVTELYKG